MNKRTKYLIITLAITTSATLQAQDVITANFQGGGAAVTSLASDTTVTPIAYTGTAINNVTAAANTAGGITGGTGDNLVWTDGTSSGISVALNIGDPAKNFNGGPTSGGTAISAGYLALHNNFTNGVVSGIENSFTFEGLDDLLTYRFAFITQGDVAGQGSTISLGLIEREITGQDITGTTGPDNDGITYTIFDGVQSSGGTVNFGITTASSESGGSQNFIALSGFQITTGVPEPSTYAMLAGLAALSFVALRRRK